MDTQPSAGIDTRLERSGHRDSLDGRARPSKAQDTNGAGTTTYAGGGTGTSSRSTLAYVKDQIRLKLLYTQLGLCHCSLPPYGNHVIQSF